MIAVSGNDVHESRQETPQPPTPTPVSPFVLFFFVILFRVFRRRKKKKKFFVCVAAAAVPVGPLKLVFRPSLRFWNCGSRLCLVAPPPHPAPSRLFICRLFLFSLSCAYSNRYDFSFLSCPLCHLLSLFCSTVGGIHFIG